MSVVQPAGRITPRSVRSGLGRPLVALTAHSAPVAGLLDPHCDLLLVGDSLGMVVYGFDSTLPVTLDLMIAHGAAVVRASKRACVVVDMPFGSYGESPAQAYRHAARVLAETGCAAVKLEGGQAMAETIRFLHDRGIPVLGHIGLQPQSVQAQGYAAQGRAAEDAARIVDDALAVQAAGAFATVLEGTVEPLARQIAETLDIPVIGIGASAGCDGQILVTDDLLGLFTRFTPRFVRRYAELAQTIDAAVSAYADDVRAGRFPGPEHVFQACSPAT